jgi:hypothetical protein
MQPDRWCRQTHIGLWKRRYGRCDSSGSRKSEVQYPAIFEAVADRQLARSQCLLASHPGATADRSCRRPRWGRPKIRMDSRTALAACDVTLTASGNGNAGSGRSRLRSLLGTVVRASALLCGEAAKCVCAKAASFESGRVYFRQAGFWQGAGLRGCAVAMLLQLA